jgi:ribosomal protein S11
MMFCGWDSIQFIKKRTKNQYAWQIAGSVNNKKVKEQTINGVKLTFSNLCLLIVVVYSKKVLESLERAR